MTWLDFLESTSSRQQISPAYQRNYHEPGRADETTHDNEAATDSGAEGYEEFHPNTPLILGSGPGFIDTFNADEHAEKRKENLFFPFSSKAEWGLASWLLRSGLSMRAIDDFLALSIVSHENRVTEPS